MSGAGADIWGASDQFQYVYQPLDGNGTIVAAVTAVQGQDPWTKVGVMIRADLTADGAYAMVAVTPSNGTIFQSRATSGWTEHQYDRRVCRRAALGCRQPKRQLAQRLLLNRRQDVDADGNPHDTHGDAGVRRNGRDQSQHFGDGHRYLRVHDRGLERGDPDVDRGDGPFDAGRRNQLCRNRSPGPRRRRTPCRRGAQPGDYDGDGKADLAIFRPSTGAWQILTSSARLSASPVVWGTTTDVPVPGDYDGDGKTDIAFYRPSLGLWSIRASSANDPAPLEIFIHGR